MKAKTAAKTDHETVRISGPAVRQLWRYSAETCIPKARVVSMAVSEFIAARRAKA